MDLSSAAALPAAATDAAKRSASVTPLTPRLQSLYEEVGSDRGIVDRFATDYLSMLDQRLAAIGGVLSDDSSDDTFTAVLSLEASSAMIGASEVANAARAVRNAMAHRHTTPPQAGDKTLPEAMERLLAAVSTIRSDLECAGYGDAAPQPRGG